MNFLQQWKEEKKMLPGENPESKEDDSSKEEIEERMRKRLEEQTSEHNGGDYWIGTMGKSSYGNTGAHTGGIRMGDQKRPPVCLRRHGRTQVQRFPG